MDSFQIHLEVEQKKRLHISKPFDSLWLPSQFANGGW